MSQPLPGSHIEQFGVNHIARRSRHLKVFAKSTFLKWPSFSFNFPSKSAVLGKIAPILHRGQVEAHHYTSPSQRLFTRYSAMVAVLFFIGSFSPTNADSDGYAMGFIDNSNYWDQTNTDTTLITDQDGYLTKINPQTNIGDRTTVNDFLSHTVASGETVSTIAAQYNLKQNTILWANNLEKTSTLKVGQKLVVPPTDGIYHQVVKSDTVTKIAKAYDIKADSIIKQNSLLADSALTPGDELFIPGAKPLIAQAPVSTSKFKTSTVRDTPARVASSNRVLTAATDGGAILQGTKVTPVGNKPFIFPTHGTITQGFHPGHPGYDIANTARPMIWAAGSGTVVKVVDGCVDVSYHCGGGYGNHVIIDHGNGIKTLYGHMTYPTVHVGDHVGQGDVIGKMGRSGNVRGRTGIHVHFEVWVNTRKEPPGNYY